MADTTTGWTTETANAQLDLVSEALADLQQLMVEDRGWARLDGSQGLKLSREELTKAAQRCRVMAAMNPLIKRGLTVRAGYVWGQGLGVTAKDDTVNELVQEFLDDDENRSVLTGHQAHLDLEHRLGTDGNVLISLWTDPMTGRVRPRLLAFEEVVEKDTDPDDKTKVRYYKRQHMAAERDTVSGEKRHRLVTTYYPDLRYRPLVRPRFIGGAEVRWDAPVLHVHDNGLPGTDWGLGDAYAALPWATAYKDFLTDWARLTKALSRIAWNVSAPDKSKALTARKGLANLAPGEAGQTVVHGGGMTVEAVPKTGATIDSESGRPLAAMVAAALGVPVTTLLADPGVTGARATAETLDTPTELEMTGRRELWTEAYRAVLGYVIDQAALAPAGPLRGTAVRDGDRLTVDLGEGVDRTLVFSWPDLTGDDMSTVIEAAVKALDTGKMPDAAVVELILRALGLRDVDELMDKITDAEGNLIDRSVTAGDAAVRAFRQGADPAEAL